MGEDFNIEKYAQEVNAMMDNAIKNFEKEANTMENNNNTEVTAMTDNTNNNTEAEAMTDSTNNNNVEATDMMNETNNFWADSTYTALDRWTDSPSDFWLLVPYVHILPLSGAVQKI